LEIVIEKVETNRDSIKEK